MLHICDDLRNRDCRLAQLVIGALHAVVAVYMWHSNRVLFALLISKITQLPVSKHHLRRSDRFVPELTGWLLSKGRTEEAERQKSTMPPRCLQTPVLSVSCIISTLFLAIYNRPWWWRSTILLQKRNKGNFIYLFLVIFCCVIQAAERKPDGKVRLAALFHSLLLSRHFLIIAFAW